MPYNYDYVVVYDRPPNSYQELQSLRCCVSEAQSGRWSDSLVCEIISRLVTLTKMQNEQYVVCFIPFGGKKTESRCFAPLYDILESRFMPAVHILPPEGILPSEGYDFNGKRVILIGTVMKHESQYWELCNEFYSRGAMNVDGIYITSNSILTKHLNYE